MPVAAPPRPAVARPTAARRTRYHEPTLIAALDDEKVYCRTLGHSWDDYLPMKRPAKFGDRLSFRCVRCATVRHDIVSWVDGQLLDRQYEYPDDYHLAEKFSRSEFRLVLINRRRKQAREVDVRDI
jgi:hypothetical protein